MERLAKETPRNHLDMRHRLDKEGKRYGKVIDYRYVLSSYPFAVRSTTGVAFEQSTVFPACTCLVARPLRLLLRCLPAL